MSEDTKQCAIICSTLAAIVAIVAFSIGWCFKEDADYKVKMAQEGMEQAYEIGKGYTWVRSE